MLQTASDIRRQFIAFFVDRCGHTEVPSGSVVPHDDPTLLFTNAGMNQFKDVFLGLGDRPFSRAVDTQKCIRAGGKHNDLEDVGRDTYHHTFFEMLGNWSFGDYFKAEAIAWAWELFTEVWKLDKSRLYVTVFSGDEQDGLEGDVETENLWKELTDIDPEHITRWDRKDNFWEMGNTGPCGPCSEIHYDDTPEGNAGHLVNRDDPRVIELWNLVFIQFNRGNDGTLTELPHQHVDTGLGFERIVRILQGKTSNYDTDLWTPIFESISQRTGAPMYNGSLEEPVDIAYRVIADHIRCLVVALADGGRPSATGRGYVLRRILRRGVRHARQTLGEHGTLLCHLVPSVVETIGDAFPEIEKNAEHIAEIIRDEEESFLKTLDRGLELFDKAVAEGDGKSIDAHSAFTLHDTFGFPIDLTEVMAEERSMTVDRRGYESLMDAARETSKATSDIDLHMQLPPEVLANLKSRIAPTDDVGKYDPTQNDSTIQAIWNGKELVDCVDDATVVGIILDQTSFYAEAGGQVGDTGSLQHGSECTFTVEETCRCGDYVLHIGSMECGVLRCNDRVAVEIHEQKRAGIESNHTGTHLMNLALRNVLGEDVQQRGSLVDHDRLRFDFSHAHALTDEELVRVEKLVNDSIAADCCVDAKEVPLKQAQALYGVRAVFGERYPDPVRVVSIGATLEELLADPSNKNWQDCSIEFCGGTHLRSCADAGHFIVLHEQALSSGIRRILAVTGGAAKEAQQNGSSLIQRIETLQGEDDATFKVEYEETLRLVDVLAISQSIRHAAKLALKDLHHRMKAFQKEEASSRRDIVLEQARHIAELEDEIVVASIDGADKDSMLTALDAVRSKRPDGAVMLFTTDKEEGKVIIVAGVGKSLMSKGLKAGDWVREAAKACGGGGGGRPDTAQAGGKNPEKVPDAMEVAREFVKEATQ